MGFLIESVRRVLYNPGTPEVQLTGYASISIEELVRRCSASREPDAWEEFVRRFHRLIAAVVLRTASRLGDCSTQAVDDLIQETYLKLCSDRFRLLRQFDQRHPDAFLGFVRVVAANVVRDHFKSLHSIKRGAKHTENISEDLFPIAAEESAGSPKAIQRTVLIHEIERHLAVSVSGPDEDRNARIFWLYYRTGLSAAAIATLPGIGLTTKGVESLILRITRELRSRMVDSSRSCPTVTRGVNEGILPAESL
jgi:RNA polymerase sigma-70 factor, ECF subfamily